MKKFLAGSHLFEYVGPTGLGLTYACAAYFESDFVDHLAAGIDQSHHVPTRPGQPLRFVAACKLFAVHQPSHVTAFGAETQALVARWNVRIERHDGARRGGRDAAWHPRL